VKPGILGGLRIIEGASYVAAPSAAVTLAQMGADVIKFDPIGGGIDYRRYPLSSQGKSIFWSSMNKGKRSQQLLAASGEEGGIFLTNFALRGGLSFETLRQHRPDLIYAVVCGNRQGGSEVDYTVNPQVGYPYLTGSRENPVNHALPAWDLMTGQVTALSILAAERHRRLTGEGQYLKVPLKDVALFAVSSMGLTTEFEVNAVDRPSVGNHIYGAYGTDFVTADGKRIMLVGLTNKQWQAIKKATGLDQAFNELGDRLNLDLDRFEEHRFEAREELDELINSWLSQRTFSDISQRFNDWGVCWSQYRSIGEAVSEDPDLSEENPLFAEVDQPGIGSFLASTAPMIFGDVERTPVQRAPVLGEHTDEILSGLLGLDDSEIGALHDRGIVAGPGGD
jgi:2-methylfumaryl-CoA isomerase